MREIKFRGKREDNGDWVFGYLAEIETAWDRYEHGSLPTEYEKVIIRTDFLTREPVAITPETVGQFTGLKDKNGVDIYEGDIVRAWSQGTIATGKVERRVDGLWIMYPAYQYKQFWGLCPNHCGETSVEVIGNIYEGVTE